MRPYLLIAALLLPVLTGCSVEGVLTHSPQSRGNKVDPEVLGQLVPGTSSRADATALLGSPTIRGMFDDNTWLYIAETTKPRIAGTLEVEDQNVVVLTFDPNGILRKIEKRSQNDASDVSMVTRFTPSPGNNASVLQQLLGNVGRFSPGGTAKTPATGGTGGANSF